MKNLDGHALIALALIVVSALISGALIVCSAPGWRVLWVLWPLVFGLFAIVGFGSRVAPEKPTTPPRRQEPD